MDLPSRIHCLRLEVQLSNKNHKEKSHEKDTTQAGAIIHKLRRAEVLLGQGKKTEEACRELGISDATYYKWRREYGGMGVSQVKRLKHLEEENARLKRLVADMELDIRVLKDAVEGNFQALSGSVVV